MRHFLFTAVCRDHTGDEGAAPPMSESPPRGLFAAEDEDLLTSVAGRFEALGFEVERDIGPTYDSLWITPRGSINPSWIIVRQHDGRYQLQDGLLGIERQGWTLREVLPPYWLAPRAP